MTRAYQAAALALSLALCSAAACFGAGDATLRILFTFDARGRLPVLGEGPGDSAAPMPEILRWGRIAAENERAGSLLLDCGNTFFPGVLSRFSYGSVQNEILGLAGASAKRVSQRDFLMGTQTLRTLQRKSAAAFLASNLEADSAPFPASVTLRRAGRAVTVFALSDPSGGDASAELPEGFSITDPESALRARVASIHGDSSLVICLLDENLAARHPGILSVPGVNLFAIGSTHSGPIVQAALRNGGWVVHVPPFPQGFGRFEWHIEVRRDCIGQFASTTAEHTNEPCDAGFMDCD